MRAVDDLLRKVLALQPSWTWSNSDAMEERGKLIRSTLPEAIAADLPHLAEQLGLPLAAVGVEGRDATGSKSQIPWVRIFGREQSPTVREGWCLVYLFSATGERAYLSLMQSTTMWIREVRDYKVRPHQDLQARARWALPAISDAITVRDDVVRELRLDATTKVGKTYPPGNLLALEYHRESMPTASTLRKDLRFMSGLLGRLYAAEARTILDPDAPAPEVVLAEESAARAAGRRIRSESKTQASGQGLGLTAAERKLIESHAVQMATGYFEKLGWKVEDVGAVESFDLLLRRGEEICRAEVKGTTSLGRQVVLTRAEVEKQREYFPHNALAVVHSIRLDRTREPAMAFGGEVECITGWKVAETDLTPISYVYRIPR
jgi:hypothetical protein